VKTCIDSKLTYWYFSRRSISTRIGKSLLLEQIDKQIGEAERKIIVIDNITWLSRETDRGKFALPLMQRLSALKKERDLVDANCLSYSKAGRDTAHHGK
jgi:hypothetical protein